MTIDENEDTWTSAEHQMATLYGVIIFGMFTYLG
tara:strand:- start:128 stop:229 length:102 start_codon:yes stop_codon:yes gene_type:complete